MPRTVSLSSRPSVVQFSDEPPRPWTNTAGGRSGDVLGVSLTSTSTPATGTVRVGHCCVANGTDSPVTAP
jgi:hypothetical protein